MATKAEKVTTLLCALSDSERRVLVTFWRWQLKGIPVNAAMLLDDSRPRTLQAVSATFVKFRELGILRTDKKRKSYWPRHHSPSDTGLKLIALILGTQGEPN